MHMVIRLEIANYRETKQMCRNVYIWSFVWEVQRQRVASEPPPASGCYKSPYTFTYLRAYPLHATKSFFRS